MREYGFVHMETTGPTSGIVVPGAVGPPGPPEGFPETIVFSSDSDRDAVESLNCLDASVLLPNANGHGIVVVGALDPEVRHTPSGPGRAMSEPYRAFRLSRWYLRAPFIRRRVQTVLDDDLPPDQHDDRLQAEDFNGRIGGDLSRFVRSR